jgi:hypothetical protein
MNIPGVELFYETLHFTWKNKEFQLVALLIILRQNSQNESWRELKLLSNFSLSFFLISCGPERKARTELRQKY